MTCKGVCAALALRYNDGSARRQRDKLLKHIELQSPNSSDTARDILNVSRLHARLNELTQLRQRQSSLTEQLLRIDGGWHAKRVEAKQAWKLRANMKELVELVDDFRRSIPLVDKSVAQLADISGLWLICHMHILVQVDLLHHLRHNWTLCTLLTLVCQLRLLPLTK
jgi:hypothetical protein